MGLDPTPGHCRSWCRLKDGGEQLALCPSVSWHQPKVRMLRQHTVEQLARVGGHSVGIVVLVVFVVGAVISMQIGPLLQDYGVVIMIADVAGISFLRELGPMLTAVVPIRRRPSPRSWAP